MRFKLVILMFLLLTGASYVMAQQLFSEGIITYGVRIVNAEGQSQAKGTYTLTVKGKMIRKQLKLENGYESTIIYNGNVNTVYSLQINSGKKYAVQLNAEEMETAQKEFTGFKLNEVPGGTKNIAGTSCQAARVSYSNGMQGAVCYTKDWKITEDIMFDRFPGIGFIPMAFEYKNEHGFTIYFEASSLNATAVDNAVFRLPQDYKIIANKEYKLLNK